MQWFHFDWNSVSFHWMSDSHSLKFRVGSILKNKSNTYNPRYSFASETGIALPNFLTVFISLKHDLIFMLYPLLCLCDLRISQYWKKSLGLPAGSGPRGRCRYEILHFRESIIDDGCWLAARCAGLKLRRNANRIPGINVSGRTPFTRKTWDDELIAKCQSFKRGKSRLFICLAKTYNIRRELILLNALCKSVWLRAEGNCRFELLRICFTTDTF